MGRVNHERRERPWFGRLAVSALLTALALTACSSGGGGNMRAEQVTTLSCDARGLEERTLRPADVRALVVCPMPGQNVRGPIEVPKGTSAFTDLIEALNRPSAPRSHGACPAFELVINRILASTTKGDYVVLPPVDSCGTVQPGVVAAVRRIAG